MNPNSSHRAEHDESGAEEGLARSVLSAYPKIAASPGFDAGVWRRLAARDAASPMRRIAALLERPWLKTLASGLGGAGLGLFLMMVLASLLTPPRPGQTELPLAPAPATTIAAMPGSAPAWSLQNRLAMRAWREQARNEFDRERDFGIGPGSDRPVPLGEPSSIPQRLGRAGASQSDKGTSWKLGAAPGSESPSSRSAGSLC